MDRCQHDYEKIENKYVCKKCKKFFLHLEKLNDNISVGIKSDGTKYTVRNQRKRYFFPDEWNEFIATFENEKHALFFQLLLYTGGRTMEVLNLKKGDFDLDRGTVNFRITKQRKAKKNFYATGKTRTFFVSSKCLEAVARYNRKFKLGVNDYYFLDRAKLPENYDTMSNSEMTKHYISAETSYFMMMKRKLKNTSIKDPENFSLHNIRKTYGMYMKTFNIEIGELCYRLGHDLDTYLAHYGSCLVFTPDEKREIMKIFGDVK